MDRLIVAEKLESLRRCLNRIQQKTPLEEETLSQGDTQKAGRDHFALMHSQKPTTPLGMGG